MATFSRFRFEVIGNSTGNGGKASTKSRTKVLFYLFPLKIFRPVNIFMDHFENLLQTLLYEIHIGLIGQDKDTSEACEAKFRGAQRAEQADCMVRQALQERSCG